MLKYTDDVRFTRTISYTNVTVFVVNEDTEECKHVDVSVYGELNDENIRTTNGKKSVQLAVNRELNSRDWVVVKRTIKDVVKETREMPLTTFIENSTVVE